MFFSRKTKVLAEELGYSLLDDYVFRRSRDEDIAQERAFARQLGFDEKKFGHEKLYYRLFLVDFIVTTVLGPTLEKKRVLDAFYARLFQQIGPDVARAEIDRRFPRYTSAANAPHPEYGRGHSLAIAFEESFPDGEHDPVLRLDIAHDYAIACKYLGELIRGVRIK